jgi:hypothetical protein
LLGVSTALSYELFLRIRGIIYVWRGTGTVPVEEDTMRYIIFVGLGGDEYVRWDTEATMDEAIMEAVKFAQAMAQDVGAKRFMSETTVSEGDIAAGRTTWMLDGLWWAAAWSVVPSDAQGL